MRRPRLSPRIAAAGAYLAQCASEAVAHNHVADARRLLRAVLILTRPARRKGPLATPTPPSTGGAS